MDLMLDEDEISGYIEEYISLKSVLRGRYKKIKMRQ